MVIRYGFHLRCGETVVVTRHYRHGDEVALTIRQPDGSPAQLPIWMTEDRAAAMEVAEFPRLPLACLRELRLELDACQSLLRDEGLRPGAGDTHAASATERPPTRPLRAREPTDADCGRRAAELLALVSALLTEALAAGSVSVERAMKITPDHLARRVHLHSAVHRRPTRQQS